MKKLLCALLCLMVLFSSVSAFAASEKSASATITMNLESFYIWSIPVDTSVKLFEKTLWGNVMATNILLHPNYVLNLYMGYGDGFALTSGTNTISYNLYNNATDTLADDAVALAESDFTKDYNSDKLYKLIGTANSTTEESRADIVTKVFYETTTTPPVYGTYTDTVSFYALVEDYVAE